MPSPEGQDKINQARRGRWWDVLEASPDMTADEVRDRHLDLTLEYEGELEVLKALNQALAHVLEEIKQQTEGSHKPKIPIIHRKTEQQAEGGEESKEQQEIIPPGAGVLRLVGALLAFSPIRFVAIACTVMLLWYERNIVLIVIVCLVALPFIIAIQKQNYNAWYYGTSALILIWGSLSTTFFLIFSNYTQIWTWASVILSLISGLLASVYPCAFIFEYTLEKAYPPNPWKSTGAFCALFMTYLGIAYILINGVPIIQITTNFLNYIQDNYWVMVLTDAVLILVIFPLIAHIFSGAIFSRSGWVAQWEEAPEFLFIISMMITVFVTYMLIETINYSPGFTEGLRNAAAGTASYTNPALQHLRDYLPYYGIGVGLAVPLYFIFLPAIRGFLKNSRLITIRIIAGAWAFFIGILLSGWIKPPAAVEAQQIQYAFSGNVQVTTSRIITPDHDSYKATLQVDIPTNTASDSMFDIQ